MSKATTRKIAGTDFRVRVVYISADRSFRQYGILAADGTFLGNVTSHAGHLGLSAGYHEGLGSRTHRSRSFRNLAEAAEFFAAQKATA